MDVQAQLTIVHVVLRSIILVFLIVSFRETYGTWSPQGVGAAASLMRRTSPAAPSSQTGGTKNHRGSPALNRRKRPTT